MKKRYLLFLFAAALFACQNDSNTETSNMTAVSSDTPAAPTSLEEMKKSALDEGDIFGRVENSLIPLQRELTNAEGKVPGVGKVTVFVDSNLTMLIKNELPKETIETVVNLRSLDPDNMRLVADNGPGTYPGLKLLVLDGMSGVTTRKGREVLKEERELIIYLPQRHNVEAITAPISQALNVVHGRN